MAAALPLSLPTNVAASGTSYVTKASAAFSGAAFNSALTTQVAGKAVTVPATWRLASNAGQVAASAIRLNPAGLASSLVISWLASYGLQWINNQWQVTQVPGDLSQGFRWQLSSNGQIVDSPEAACTIAGGFFGKTLYPYAGNGPPPTLYYCSQQQGSFVSSGYQTTRRAECQTGYVLSGGLCTSTQKVPAGDADWAKVTGAPTDAVATELAAKPIALPLQAPQIDTTPQVIPLSEPYIDPVTGKRYKDVAYVTPSATNPKTADLQVAKQEVDANGNPVTDPGTGGVKAPEETDDPCLAHPERIGCMEKGDIPAPPELQGENKPITIAADSGWGADTAACPADLTTTTRTGAMLVSFSFKPACDAADTFRPLVIGLAWLAAVLIALGVGRKGD